MTALSVHHVGVAVADLAVAVERYRTLFGADVEGEERLEPDGVEVAALRLGAAGRVELMAPLGEDTPVGRFLARRGPGLHHVAYGVPDLGAELGRLRDAGATLIDETPRRGFYGSVAFIHHESVLGVLTELVQA